MFGQTDVQVKASDLPSGGVNADVVLGLMTLVLAAVAYWQSQGLTRFGGLFVYHCVVVLAVLGSITVVTGLIKPKRTLFFDSVEERNRVVGGVLLLAAYLWSLSYAGFLLSSMLFYFVLQRTLAPDRLSIKVVLKTALIACVVTLILYALFHHLLLVPLPPGVWFS